MPFPNSGELWVDDVRLMAGDKADSLMLKDKIAVGPETIPVGHLYFAGRPTPTTLDIVNTDTAAHKVSVQAIAVDCEGKPLPAVAAGTFDVPAVRLKTTTFNIDTGRKGSFRLTFELSAEGQRWRQSAEYKYAVIVPLSGVGDAEESAFAMNTHMEREPTPHLARSMEVLSQCGVKWIRAWWGWGMCEQTKGKFDFAEYDRQFNTVAGAKMCIMPILLRYYNAGYGFSEKSWAGPTTPRAIQECPSPAEMPEFGVWAGKVAQHFAGKIKAYEIWNEPTMGTSPNGVLTSQQYADMLNAATPAIRQNDPKTKIVGFAGVPLDYLEKTLKLGVAPRMDVVSEHSYSQIEMPEINLPKQTKSVRAILAEYGNKPIWHTEQGVVGDGDGYSTPALPEAEIASLYTRNLVLLRSLGIEKYFWFSAQTSPTYGNAIYYEDYVPRPRLTALNACASFLEGATCRQSYRPSDNAYAFLFEGAEPTGVVWNMNVPALLILPIAPGRLKAFDMMGNAMEVGSDKGGALLDIPAERPIFLRCGTGDAGALKKAIEKLESQNRDTVLVTEKPTAAGIEVTVTGRSGGAQDGVVELVPAAGNAPADWPAAQHFQSLGLDASKSFTFVLTRKGAAGEVRVRVGDRRMQEVRTYLPK